MNTSSIASVPFLQAICPYPQSPTGHLPVDYEIISGVTGRMVRYGCPQCGSKLVNPLSQAGSRDYCPDCDIPHAVPGGKERTAESERQAIEEKQKLAGRQRRQQATSEDVVNRVAKKAQKDRKLQLDRDPFREWLAYIVIVGGLLSFAAGRHIASAIMLDDSGLCIVIIGLFFVGATLNLLGVRQLRNEYVCAASCLNAMKQPNGLRELLTLPAAGVFHQHIKDLASIAKYDTNVSQDGLISLLYSRMIAKSKIVEVLSSVLVSLGLIGTVIGLISMTNGLSGALESLDNKDGAASLLAGMRTTMAGLGTAFYTTLVGAFLGSVALRVLNNVYTSNVDHLVSYIASITEVRIVPLLKNRSRSQQSAKNSR